MVTSPYYHETIFGMKNEPSPWEGQEYVKRENYDALLSLLNAWSRADHEITVAQLQRDTRSILEQHGFHVR